MFVMADSRYFPQKEKKKTGLSARANRACSILSVVIYLCNDLPIYAVCYLFRLNAALSKHMV